MQENRMHPNYKGTERREDRDVWWSRPRLPAEKSPGVMLIQDRQRGDLACPASERGLAQGILIENFRAHARITTRIIRKLLLSPIALGNPALLLVE